MIVRFVCSFKELNFLLSISGRIHRSSQSTRQGENRRLEDSICQKVGEEGDRIDWRCDAGHEFDRQRGRHRHHAREMGRRLKKLAEPVIATSFLFGAEKLHDISLVLVMAVS